MPTVRLYAGNIPFAATEADLRELLAPYRPVEIRIAFDRKTGRPRGFAHATLPSQELAEEAVAALDGTPFMGRKIVLAPATPRGQGPDLSRRTDFWNEP